MRSQRRTCERSDEGMERQQAERMDGRAHGGKSRAFPGHQNLQRRLAKGVKATEGVEITNYRRAAHQPNIGTHIRGPCGQSLSAGYKYLNRGSLLLTALRSGSRVSSYLHLGLSCHASLRLRRSRRLVLGRLGLTPPPPSPPPQASLLLGRLHLRRRGGLLGFGRIGRRLGSICPMRGTHASMTCVSSRAA